jgi:hypothetical protein
MDEFVLSVEDRQRRWVAEDERLAMITAILRGDGLRLLGKRVQLKVEFPEGEPLGMPQFQLADWFAQLHRNMRAVHGEYSDA